MIDSVYSISFFGNKSVFEPVTLLQTQQTPPASNMIEQSNSNQNQYNKTKWVVCLNDTQLDKQQRPNLITVIRFLENPKHPIETNYCLNKSTH